MESESLRLFFGSTFSLKSTTEKIPENMPSPSRASLSVLSETLIELESIYSREFMWVIFITDCPVSFKFTQSFKGNCKKNAK